MWPAKGIGNVRERDLPRHMKRIDNSIVRRAECRLVATIEVLLHSVPLLVFVCVPRPKSLNGVIAHTVPPRQ